MQKYKILIIDDSALMRRVTSDIINTDNRFTVGYSSRWCSGIRFSD